MYQFFKIIIVSLKGVINITNKNTFKLFLILCVTLVVMPLTATSNILTHHHQQNTNPTCCAVEWELLSEGFGNINNFATRGICVYNNEVYIGTDSFNTSKPIKIQDIITFIQHALQKHTFESWAQYRYSLKSDGCEIWKYNDTSKELHQIVGNLPEANIGAGFGNTNNSLASFLIEFNGKLYVGTDSNVIMGCEVWRYDGVSWEQVVSGGFGDLSNDGAHSAYVFQDHLYIGTMNWDNTDNGFCQIWRSADGETWTKVVDKGFRDLDPTNKTHNRYAWCFAEYNNELYVGTYNHPALFADTGGQLWKTSDGVTWTKVLLPKGDGFGEAGNHGIRNMQTYNDMLYVGVASIGFNGLEMWRYDGEQWTPLISDEVPGVKLKPWDMHNDGFGDRSNDYPYAMVVTSDNLLWVGTLNAAKGCELYQFDGASWTQVVGDDAECEVINGFGESTNAGIRSLVEYPVGSGSLVAGTATSFTTPDVCQVWMRRVI